MVSHLLSSRTASAVTGRYQRPVNSHTPADYTPYSYTNNDSNSVTVTQKTPSTTNSNTDDDCCCSSTPSSSSDQSRVSSSSAVVTPPSRPTLLSTNIDSNSQDSVPRPSQIRSNVAPVSNVTPVISTSVSNSSNIINNESKNNNDNRNRNSIIRTRETTAPTSQSTTSQSTTNQSTSPSTTSQSTTGQSTTGQSTTAQSTTAQSAPKPKPRRPTSLNLNATLNESSPRRSSMLGIKFICSHGYQFIITFKMYACEKVYILTSYKYILNSNNNYYIKYVHYCNVIDYTGKLIEYMNNVLL